MRSAAWVLAGAMLSSQAAADIVSPAPDSVRVTIYREPNTEVGWRSGDEDDDATTGLAMVVETRTVDIPAGASKLVFRGVADAIVPQTAGVEGLPAAILESNFDYDLLTPGAVIAKSHGERVRRVHTDKATGRITERAAIIRSGPEGVVLDVDGGIEALNCSGLAEKLIFERIPTGLADEPTLSMTINAERAGRYTIQLSYLALGLDWSADYVANISPDGRTLNLTGWITLVNRASTTFANAPTDVVAGYLARDKEETQPPGATHIDQRPACWPIGSFLTSSAPARRVGFPEGAVGLASDMSAMAIQETVVTGSRSALEARMSELGDYKLYTLPEPTTVAARQSKQVRLLTRHDVPFTRVYTFKLDESSSAQSGNPIPQRPIATLRLHNRKSDGLGRPLPAGTISVMESADPTFRVLAGQDTLDDTPVGLPFEIELGKAMDVLIEPRVLADDTIDEGSLRERHAEIEVKIGNDKPIPVLIEYRHPGSAEGFRIVSESQRHTQKSGDPMWTFKLKPGGRAVLRYTVRQRA